MDESKYVWVHYSTATGTEDYSVTDWSAAKEEAVSTIQHSLCFIVDDYTRAAILYLLASDDWLEGVSMFNEHNAMKEYLSFREGEKAV